MKKQFIAALAMAASMSAFAQGTIATQEGFGLTREWSIDVAVQGITDHRSGVGINDKFYVNAHATGILVYDKDGNLLKTIPATTGYHNWISCNVDAAGHVLAQVDVKAFDGSCSPSGNHGFMVIDSKTDEVAKDFLPMTFGWAQRFDAMAPVDQDILNDFNTRILSVLNAGTSSYQFSYNRVDQDPDTIPPYGYWKTAAFATNANLDVFCEGAKAQTTTGYALQYPVSGAKPEAAILANPYFSGSNQRGTFSGPGMFGNAIRKYTGNWTASADYFYTPMHAGITGFNLFYLDGKQYIVYPTICLQSNGNYVNPADAIAIAEVSYVQSPATDMTMEGEALVDGLPVGVVKAVVLPEMSGEFVKYTANTACPPSYNVEPVEGDPKSVYIYMYNSGAPCVKYKFSVGVEPTPELPGTGEGTLDSPYDVARVLGMVEAGMVEETATDDTPEVYLAGVISAIKEVSTSFGNATYTIKDADAENAFGIYRGLYLDQAKFTAEDQIAVNDTVVVCGKLVNYKGNTPQMTQGNYLVSIKKAPVVVDPNKPVLTDCTGTAEVTVSASDFDGKIPGEVFVGTKDEADTYYGFNVEKGAGQTAPAFNTNAQAVRLYASNTMAVYGGKLTSIQFVLDQKNQGKRYCPVTASTGTIAEQAVGDSIVVWTGDATEVVFTVGELATLGTENTKPGQIHFLSLVINAPIEDEPEPEPEPAVTATLGNVATQEGYILEALWTADEISAAGTTNRSGVGVNDKFYVNYYGEGVRVYSNTGKLLKTIPPTEGYHNWVSCNVDQAGYVYVQLDVKAFDGQCSIEGKHGFMVIDSKTDEVVVPFLPMTFGYDNRFDAMSPIQGNIFETEKLGIWSVLTNGTSTYRFLYNAVGAEKPSYWTTKAATTSTGIVATDDVPSLFPAAAAKQTSTGYAMQYVLEGDENFSIAVYANPLYNVTYSAEGMYGNGIRKYTAAYVATDQWFYTPMHSGLTAFNFFNIGGKDYIIYPAGLENVSADAFAIAEVSYVSGPATDMDMLGETLVEGKPAGALKARAFAAMNEAGTTALYPGNPSTVPSYNVVPVDGDEKSVYIYVYSNGAPGVKYKFTADPQDGIMDAIATEGEGQAEYYNLQGIRIANPGNGVYIMRQGNKVSKVIR